MHLGKRLYSFFMFLIVSALGGVLAAGLLVPVVGMSSSAGTFAATSLTDMPSELVAPEQWQGSKLLTSDGKVLANFYDQNRVYVTLDKIAPIMQQAQVAIEDHRFYEHGAMDLTGTLRALVSTSQGNTQGGSSITQQYVRLVLVEKAEDAQDAAALKAAKENTLARKIRELRYAIAVEKQLTKDQILERYLNLAYYGDGAYGVEAAAKHYFGVTAAQLNLPQAAMLAGLVRNPVSTNPVTHTVVGLERRNNVLDRMAQLGVISQDEATQAKATQFDKSKVKTKLIGCANSAFPFVCDYALKTLVQNTPSLGATVSERRMRVYRGGLTIQTEIDPKAQRSAEKVISRYLSGRDPVVSVITMMQPGTGLIRAMAQNRQTMGSKSGQTYWNYAVSKSMGGAYGFQGGSTFKMFVAAAALEEGLGAYGQINARPVMNFKGTKWKSCDGTFRLTTNWNVNNNNEGGYMNMFAGVKHSVNTYFAQLEQKVGLCAVTKMAKRLGLEMGSGGDIVDEYNHIPAFTLGAVEITPLSLTEAYATMAARGKHCDPIILKAITTKDGASLAVPSANCQQVVSQEVADAINKIFQGPYNGGTATYAKVSGVTMAGKTGTVPDNKAIWTIGYTRDLVGAAMISYDNDPKYRKFWSKQSSYLRGVHLKYSKRTLRGASGSEAGGKLLKPAFAAALKDIDDNDQFVAPKASVLRGQQVDVPDCTDMGAKTCQSMLEKAGFTTLVSYRYNDSPAGTLLRTSPAGTAAKYSTVTVVISKGPKPAAAATPAASASSTPK